jgi:hypothetical protein
VGATAGAPRTPPPTRATSSGGVTIVATEFEYDPGDFSLPADEDVELTLENKGVVEHDIVVEELDDRELVFANAGETVTETVNRPGRHLHLLLLDPRPPGPAWRAR